MTSKDMSNNTGDHRVGGIYGGVSVTVDEVCESNCSKIEEVPNPILENNKINITFTIRLQELVKFL